MLSKKIWIMMGAFPRPLKMLVLLLVLLIASTSGFPIREDHGHSYAAKSPFDLEHYSEYLHNYKCPEIKIRHYSKSLKCDEIETGSIYRYKPEHSSSHDHPSLYDFPPRHDHSPSHDYHDDRPSRHDHPYGEDIDRPSYDDRHDSKTSDRRQPPKIPSEKRYPPTTEKPRPPTPSRKRPSQSTTADPPQATEALPEPSEDPQDTTEPAPSQKNRPSSPFATGGSGEDQVELRGQARRSAPSSTREVSPTLSRQRRQFIEVDSDSDDFEDEEDEQTKDATSSSSPTTESAPSSTTESKQLPVPSPPHEALPKNQSDSSPLKLPLTPPVRRRRQAVAEDPGEGEMDGEEGGEEMTEEDGEEMDKEDDGEVEGGDGKKEQKGYEKKERHYRDHHEEEEEHEDDHHEKDDHEYDHHEKDDDHEDGHHEKDDDHEYNHHEKEDDHEDDHHEKEDEHGGDYYHKYDHKYHEEKPKRKERPPPPPPRGEEPPPPPRGEEPPPPPRGEEPQPPPRGEEPPPPPQKRGRREAPVKYYSYDDDYEDDPNHADSLQPHDDPKKSREGEDDVSYHYKSKCTAPLYYGWRHYNWYQILVENGGPPGGYLKGGLKAELEKVEDPCVRPVKPVRTELKKDFMFKYAKLGKVFRVESVNVRLANTPHEFLDYEGQIIWAPPNVTDRFYQIIYRKDDTGLYVRPVTDITCKFRETLNRHTNTYDVQLGCELHPGKFCYCDKYGGEVCYKVSHDEHGSQNHDHHENHHDDHDHHEHEQHRSEHDDHYKQDDKRNYDERDHYKNQDHHEHDHYSDHDHVKHDSHYHDEQDDHDSHGKHDSHYHDEHDRHDSHKNHDHDEHDRHKNHDEHDHHEKHDRPRKRHNHEGVPDDWGCGLFGGRGWCG